MSFPQRILWLLLLFSAAAGSQGQKFDPQDIYFQGYLETKEALELEKQSDYSGAYRKLLRASDIFDSVARGYPEWSPNMVNYRRKLVRQDIQRLHQLLPADFVEPAQPDAGRPGGSPSAVASPPANPVQRRFEDLERQVAEMNRDRDRLLSQLDQKEDSLRSARDALDQAQRYEETLRSQLAESQKNLETAQTEARQAEALKQEVETLKAQLAEANRQLTEANARTEAVLKELEQANQTIAELKRREELYLKQRREMAALIRNLDADQSTKDLVEDNMRLREQLNAAQARLEEATASGERDQGELASLRDELSSVRTELAQLQRENSEYQQEIESLRGRLELALEDQNLQTPPPGEEEAATENALLKQILMRQLRQQTRRQQAKQLVLQELERLDSLSSDLAGKIEGIAEAPPLTEAERSLLSDLTDDPELESSIASVAALPALEGDALKDRILRYAKAAAYDFERGNYEAAELSYRQILEFAPQHVNSICNLGLVEMRLNKLEEAQKSFRKALVYDDQHAFAHYLLGITHFHLEQHEAALEALRRSIGLAPNQPEFHLYLGVIALTRKDYGTAEAALQAAIDLRPTDADAHYNLAVLYATRPGGSLALATQHYQLALANGISPDRRMENLLTTP